MDQKIWIQFKKENVDPHSFCIRIVIKKLITSGSLLSKLFNFYLKHFFNIFKNKRDIPDRIKWSTTVYY